ncbi:MAG: 3-deoxy-D-manno-octulosonic acid transferase [Desulfobacterales bacterium]|nr:3-deoxy-D-manno-octulosonic acid transferase [Desulfobacterales bacterium]
MAVPFLRRNPRLAEGFDQRMLRRGLPRADLWIQAASAGECHLAVELLKNLRLDEPVRVLATTNTSQGLEILNGAFGNDGASMKCARVFPAYCPFDDPGIMEAAIRRVNPRLIVLLESELWPGLLRAARRNGRSAWVVNGRMTEKSLRMYRYWPGLWRRLRPERILAMSPGDAGRFGALFGEDVVGLMPNIKFDRFGSPSRGGRGGNPLEAFIPPGAPMVALGSVREEEEGDVGNIIREICARRPDAIIGLFPRHMHRISYWKRVLEEMGMDWIPRSGVRSPVPGGTVVLWDVFGELGLGYDVCGAAFVGGSLAPLGGQNFLEPLTAGVVPVSGPSWENFSWVGREVVERGLLTVAEDWRGVADALLASVEKPVDRDKTRAEAADYIQSRQGGAEMVRGLITARLAGGSRDWMGG